MRCFRCSIILNEQLEMIAKYEDRTVSKVIQRLLMKAVEDYREHNRDRNYPPLTVAENN